MVLTHWLDMNKYTGPFRAVLFQSVIIITNTIIGGGLGATVCLIFISLSKCTTKFIVFTRTFKGFDFNNKGEHEK
jgi:hypothetical protein